MKKKNFVLLVICFLITACSAELNNLIESDWFVEGGYGDCPTTSCRIWPSNPVDCFLPDMQPGPSEYDQTIVPEPADLQYKHLAPGIETISNTLQSLSVGLGDIRVYKDLECGTSLGSASLMVHPASEQMILGRMTEEERVESFYLPFVETIVQQPAPFEEVLRLYQAALYDCENSRGQLFNVGDYTVVVQRWEFEQGYTEDCNIHVVESE